MDTDRYRSFREVFVLTVVFFVFSFTFGIFIYMTNEDLFKGMPITWFIVGVIVIITCLVIGLILWYLQNEYYDERTVVVRKEKETEVKYIHNVKLSFPQMLVTLYRPTRYFQVEQIDFPAYTSITLRGILEVVDNQFLIDNCYLSLNTALFEYIGQDIKVVVQISGMNAYIEGYILNYNVYSVNQEN